MKKICVITATRAEYGLLYPIMKKITADSELKMQLIVTGTHLSTDFGYTKNEIVSDGFDIAKELEILMASDTAVAVSKSMGMTMLNFCEYVKDDRPDMAIILGDRYEMLAYAIVLYNENIPIAHINGGEITEGALDDNYRHCLTKLSYLHFANCEPHRQRIIQLGESPDRVFNVGDTCIDNIKNIKLKSIEELEADLKIPLRNKKIVLTTFHPVTIENESEIQVSELISAMEELTEYTYIITKSNADAGGKIINEAFEAFVEKQTNAYLVSSLGMQRFLSVLSHSTMMLGNSSSGLCEAPALGKPTVNIGNRQKGRVRSDSVIDCVTEKPSIIEAIRKADSIEFQKKAMHAENIFGDGHAAERIVEIIKDYLLREKISLPKTFYDI